MISQAKKKLEENLQKTIQLWLFVHPNLPLKKLLKKAVSSNIDLWKLWHELYHVLGFFEQRNEYVLIVKREANNVFVIIEKSIYLEGNSYPTFEINKVSLPYTSLSQAFVNCSNHIKDRLTLNAFKLYEALQKSLIKQHYS